MKTEHDECQLCGTIENVNHYGDFCLCDDCKREHVERCCNCNDSFLKDEEDYVMTSSGDIYCESCAAGGLYFCDCCNEYTDVDHITYIENLEEWYCRDCARMNARQCDDCGCWSTEDFGDMNITLCRSCYVDRYCTCDSCDVVIRQDDAHYCDDDGWTRCEECYNDHSGSSHIHNYAYTPDLNFQWADDEKPKKPLPYLGFELEAGGVSSAARRDIAEALSGYNSGFFYLKEDSSIPDYGFELVSHPITLKRHKELDWYGVFKEMYRGGMRSHDLGEESCGLHVHVSRNYLTDYKWLLVDWFISKHQDKFEIIARRKETHWARFKKSDGLPIKEVYGKSIGSRYQAVNFENRNTVEFRLFRGTLNFSTFMATLEIVDALVHWADQLSVSDILTTGDAFRNFTDYLRANSLYENAANYLNKKELI